MNNYPNYYAGPQGMHPQAANPASEYGTYEEIAPADPLTKAQSYGYFRRRLNVVAIILGYLIPWTLFCVVYGMNSFEARYFSPLQTWFFTCVILLGVVIFALSAVMMVIRRKKGQSREDPHWRVFLAVTCLAAWIAAVMAGNSNYTWHTAPYWDLVGLKTKTAVDPTVNKGVEMMDAGIIDFLGASSIDTSRSHGFKNGHTYCVAPITRDNKTLDNYDFWAVGVDCCSGEPGDFKDCVPPEQRDGKSQAVRYMFGSTDREFMRLAIQQAEAKYQIKTTHPLFLLWADDAAAFRDDYQNKGYRHYMLGMIVALVVQVALVALATSFIQENC